MKKAKKKKARVCADERPNILYIRSKCHGAVWAVAKLDDQEQPFLGCVECGKPAAFITCALIFIVSVVTILTEDS
jgi:hypothetical protein